MQGHPCEIRDSGLRTSGISPAVGRFVEANPLKAKMVAIGVAVHRLENGKGGLREILGGRDAVEDDRPMVRQAAQEVEHRNIPR